MLDSEMIKMLVEGTRDTLYMTLFATFFGYLFGLPMGILLMVTDKEGIRPHSKGAQRAYDIIYKILDVVVNIARSIPFLILLILVIPITKAIVGKSYGSTATIVPLTIAAAPFIARMVESSLKEVDRGVIEAAQSMGASVWPHYLECPACRSAHLFAGRRYDRNRHDPWLLCNGRCSRRRRTGRHCNPVRLLPLSDGCDVYYYYRTGTSGTDSAEHRYDAVQKAGQKTFLKKRRGCESSGKI